MKRQMINNEIQVQENTYDRGFIPVHESTEKAIRKICLEPPTYDKDNFLILVDHLAFHSPGLSQKCLHTCTVHV